MKKRLNADQRYGLTSEQILDAERFIRKNPNIGTISATDAVALYEMFVLGYSFEELAKRFPQYEYGRIVYTAACANWIKERERMAASIYDRIKARVIRSTVEQVEFLTDMIAVSSKESSEEVRKYLQNPTGTPPPAMRIKSFKDYQQVVEMLAKVTDSIRNISTPEEDKPKLSARKAKQLKAPVESDEAILLAELAKDSE